jgi:hypothetical protein
MRRCRVVINIQCLKDGGLQSCADIGCLCITDRNEDPLDLIKLFRSPPIILDAPGMCRRGVFPFQVKWPVDQSATPCWLSICGLESVDF